MGSLYLGGPTIQEVDGEMMIGLSNIWGCCNGWVVILQILRYCIKNQSLHSLPKKKLLTKPTTFQSTEWKW